MGWQRMRFREEIVWVKVDESGRPVVDSAGRAEMKYRESDEKSYRPSGRNLQPLTEAEANAPVVAPKPRAGARSRRASSSGSAPEGARAEAAVAPEDLVHVWTDGACSGNPGPMGIGVVVLSGGARQELGAYLGIGTNNIAELTAIERGLALAVSWLGEETAEKKAVRVYSDSNYAIGLLSKGWKAKANQELVARIRTALTPFRRLSFVKVEGHAGIAENERCDELARQAVARRR